MNSLNPVYNPSSFFGLIGKPIDTSLSPLMFNSIFDQSKINSVYVPFTVAEHDLKNAVLGLRSLGVSGFNVTIPHKVSIINELDSIDDVSLKVGAVNTVSHNDDLLMGFNTDVEGFLRPLKDMNLSLKGKKASILGSGGAARSCIFGLSTLGIDDFSIISRNKLTADKVSQDLGNDVTIAAFSSSDVSSEKAFKSSDIIVNATPIGRYPSNEFPINISWISNDQIIYDLVANPLKTKFILTAESLGCIAIPGYLMLVEQAALSFKIWTGLDAPILLMKNIVEKELGGITNES